MLFSCDYCGEQFWLNEESELVRKYKKKKLHFCDDSNYFYEDSIFTKDGLVKEIKSQLELSSGSWLDAKEWSHRYFYFMEKYYVRKICHDCRNVCHVRKAEAKRKLACGAFLCNSCAKSRNSKYYPSLDHQRVANILGINKELAEKFDLMPVIEIKILHNLLKKELKDAKKTD